MNPDDTIGQYDPSCGAVTSQAVSILISRHQQEYNDLVTDLMHTYRMHETARHFLRECAGPIACIKLLRIAFGLGLKEAKDIVDAVR